MIASSTGGIMAAMPASTSSSATTSGPSMMSSVIKGPPSEKVTSAAGQGSGLNNCDVVSSSMNVPSDNVLNSASTVLSETMPDKVINNVQVTEANVNEDVASKRGCNRCQDCTGYVAAQDWRRSTCSKCRCPRSSHDMVVNCKYFYYSKNR